MFLISSSINVSIFHITWLVTFCIECACVCVCVCVNKVKKQDASNILHIYLTSGPAQNSRGTMGFKMNRTKHEAQCYHFGSRIWVNSFNILYNAEIIVSGQATSQTRCGEGGTRYDHQITL